MYCAASLFHSIAQTKKNKILLCHMIDWKELNNEYQLDGLVAASFEKPQAIFKHSTRCYISKTVLRKLEMEWAFSVDQLDAHFLDLIANRNISNKIATLFSVEHESPQLIVISKGVVIYHDSHQAIDLSEVNRTLDSSVV